MIRDETLTLYRRPAAVNLSTFDTGPAVGGYYGHLDAVWFRHRTRTGALAAHLGIVTGTIRHQPADAAEFLRTLTDRRAIECVARWDGDSLWTLNSGIDAEKCLAILRPMLANYPSVPDGYDGWWRHS